MLGEAAHEGPRPGLSGQRPPEDLTFESSPKGQGISRKSSSDSGGTADAKALRRQGVWHLKDRQ